MRQWLREQWAHWRFILAIRLLDSLFPHMYIHMDDDFPEVIQVIVFANSKQSLEDTLFVGKTDGV